MVRESSGNNGITFGMDGPMMTGTWQNPRNGDKFTVRDCFLQDGQMIVQTMDGRMLDYNIIQNYVQCTDENGNHVNIPIQSPVSGNKKTNKQEIPQEILDMIDDSPKTNKKTNENDLIIPEDLSIFQPFSQLVTDEPMDMSGNLSYNTEDKQGNPVIMHETYDKDGNLVNKQTETLVNTDEDIDKQWAHKVLKKKSLPSINIEATWEDIPSKAIETLIETLGVEPETLIDYYVGRIYSEIDIEQEVKAKLKMVIEDVISDIKENGSADVHNAYRSTLGDGVIDNSDVNSKDSDVNSKDSDVNSKDSDVNSKDSDVNSKASDVNSKASDEAIEPIKKTIKKPIKKTTKKQKTK